MPAKKMIRVAAVPGRLYPHPDGAHRGHCGWLGWSPCTPAEAEHTIEGAAGIALKDGPAGQGKVYDPERTTGDLFLRGPDIHLRRDPEGVEVEETVDIRRALRCGDLAPWQAPAPPPAAIPSIPSLPRSTGGR